MWGFSFWPSQSSSRAESNVERYESKGEEVERLPGRELSPEDFPKLEELGIDLAPVRPFVVGSLYRLSSTDETYCKIYEEVFLGVFCDEDRDFNFQMVIAACDKVILRQNITSESLIRFVKVSFFISFLRNVLFF